MIGSINTAFITKSTQHNINLNKVVNSTSNNGYKSPTEDQMKPSHFCHRKCNNQVAAEKSAMLIKLGIVLINLFLVQIAFSEIVTNETSRNATDEIGFSLTEESTDNGTEIRYEDLGRQLRPAPRACSCLRWTAWRSYGSPRTMDWSFLKTKGYPNKDASKSKTAEYGQNHYEDICETRLSVGCRVIVNKRHDSDYSKRYSACPIYTYRSAPDDGLVQLRFLCPDYVCPCLAWSDWYDYDNPDGEGDVETLLGTIPKKQWPCVNGERPLDVDCRTLSGKRISQTNNKGVTCDLDGLKCYNRDQGPRCTCEDYKVRFLCFRGHSGHGQIVAYSDRNPQPRKPYRPQPQPPRYYPKEEEIIDEDIVVPVDEQSYKPENEYREPPMELYPPYTQKPNVRRPQEHGVSEYERDPDYIDLDGDERYEPRPLYPPHEAPRIYRNPDYEVEPEDYVKYPRPDPQVTYENDDDDQACNSRASRDYSCRRPRPRPVEAPRRTPEEDEDHEYQPPVDVGHFGDKGKGHGKTERGEQHPGNRPRHPEYPPRKEHHKSSHGKSTLIGANTDVITGENKRRRPTGEVVDADVKLIDEDSLGGILGGEKKKEHGRHNGDHKDYKDRGEHEGGKHKGPDARSEGQHSKVYEKPQPEEPRKKIPDVVGPAYKPDPVPHAGSHRKDQLLRKAEKGTLVGADVDAITGKDGPEGPDGEVIDADVAAIGEDDGPLDGLLKGKTDKNGGSEDDFENPDGEYVPPSKSSELLGVVPVGEYENPPGGAYEIDTEDISKPETKPDYLPPTPVDDKLPSKERLPVKPGTLIGADADVLGAEDKRKRPTGEVVDADIDALGKEKGVPLAGILHGGKDRDGDYKPPASSGQYAPPAEDSKYIPPASIPDVYGANPGASGEDSYKASPIQGEGIPDVPAVGKDKGVAADVLALTTKDEKADYGSITDVDVGVSSLADPSGKPKKSPVQGLLGRSGASARMVMPNGPSEDECWMKKLMYAIFAARSPTRGSEHLHKLQYRDDCPDY